MADVGKKFETVRQAGRSEGLTALEPGRPGEYNRRMSNPNAPRPDEDEREVAEFRRLTGMGAQEWGDEKDAPPIDDDELANFVTSELPRKRMAEIGLLVSRYRSWTEAA